MSAPKVFISHAWDDKDRFVLGFAKRLREKGVDAWLDQWEMNPGDSLVDKIFNEGIASAEAFIVVLSNHSVNRPWVKEELNTALVKKIAGKTKLIPVILDGCQVPTSLQSLIHVQVKDTDSYDTEFQQVLGSLFDHYEKPPIGAPPAYATSFGNPTVPGLSSLESIVLRLAVEYAIENDQSQASTKTFLKHIEGHEIEPNIVTEAISTLSFHKLAEITAGESGRPLAFSITPQGFRAYAVTYLENYDNLVTEIVSQIVNHNQHSSSAISTSTGHPRMMVMFVLKSLEADGYFTMLRTENGSGIVSSYSPALKKLLHQ